MAGYRAAFAAGDPALVRELLEVRKHAGMMVPAPVQAAMVAALGDDAHVAEQKARYAVRRQQLLAALTGAGFRVDHSQAGLYLWATRDEDCWATVEHLAGLGILVAPGSFYGPAGARHVRVALTATDERVAAAVSASLPPSGPATLRPSAAVGLAALDGDVHVVEVAQHRVAGVAARVDVVAPAEVGRPRRPDPVGVDDRQHGVALRVRHQPLREDQAAPLLLGVAEGPEEDVDRPAVVVRRPVDVPGADPAAGEAAADDRPEDPGPRPAQPLRPRGQAVRPHLLGLHLGPRVRAGQPVGRPQAEQAVGRGGHLGGRHVGRSQRDGRLDPARGPAPRRAPRPPAS